MAIDKTKRPLKIPPQFQLYAEEHGLFDLYHRMLQKLVIDKPVDPLEYMVNWLRRESDPIPKVAVIGAPSSGKHTVACRLAETLGAVLIQPSNLETTDEGVINNLKDRLTAPGSEPVRRGYVLNNMPSSRTQALLLQQAGIHPNHIIRLEADEKILISRRMGKYLDPDTGNTYHNIFNWPQDIELASNLIKAPNSNKESFQTDMQRWSRESVGIEEAHKLTENLFTVNCDQPIEDVYQQTLAIVNQPPLSESIRIPRLVILGPVGSGKHTLASHLCTTFNIVQVDANAWIKIIASDKSSSIGDAVREFQDEHGVEAALPDDLTVRCISDRLSRMDCQTKGWVLFGFPKNYAQAESINMLGHRPNKVFQLEFPLDGVIERVSNRRVDPVTGKMYNLIWNAPENAEIAERLLQAPSDQREILREQFDEYEASIKQLLQVYLEMEKQLEKPTGGILVKINADQDIDTVMEYGVSMLIKPVPLNNSST